MHICLRDRIRHKVLGLNYLAITLVSLTCICLMSVYLFMIYTIDRLTKAFRQYTIIEVRDMKDEPFKFLLQENKADGNVFQRYYSLINMSKDIYNSFALFFLYHNPLALVLTILALQLFFTVNLLLYPPYIKQWVNRMSLITQVLYCLLDVVFIWNIAGGKRISTEDRYYYIGFSLIGLVIVIIITNIGFGFYYGIRDAIIKLKNRKRKNLSRVNNKNDDTLKDSRPPLVDLKLESKQPDTSQSDLVFDDPKPQERHKIAEKKEVDHPNIKLRKPKRFRMLGEVKGPEVRTRKVGKR